MQTDHHAFARSTVLAAEARSVPHPRSSEDGAPSSSEDGAPRAFPIARVSARGGSVLNQCDTGFQPVKTRVENPCHTLTNGLVCALALVALGANGCGSFTHLTATLGGSTAGDRGTLRVILINNTPHRAAFTMGTFDDLDRFSEPVFEQFGVKDREQRLDGDTTSRILSLSCGRVFSVGGERLLDLIARNLPDETTIDEATVEGVRFYETPTDAGDADPVLIGEAPSLDALIGEDFGCGSIIVLRFEFDDAAPETAFRVDFRVIPAQSAR